MHRERAMSLALFALAALVLSAGCAEETPAASVPVVHHVPPVFSEMTYEEAKAAAEREGKLLILDVTARWCGPCKLMDRHTWVDEAVVDWVEEHAIAVQLDVDKRRTLAIELGVCPPVPIVVVFKDGDEFGRVLGKQTPEELLEWLNDAL
jgi:thioredoxin 1